MRLMHGIFLFLLGPNMLMFCVRLDPYPGLFWQNVGCVCAAILSWLGGDIIHREKRKWDASKSA